MKNEFVTRIPDILPIPARYKNCATCDSLNPSNHLCLKRDNELFHLLDYKGKNWTSAEWKEFNEKEVTAFVGRPEFVVPSGCPYLLEYTIDT